MQRTSFAPMACSIAQALEVVGSWWTPLIVRDVYLGLHRFDDLAVNLGISRNLLAGRLSELVDRGILRRRRYQDKPARHDYHLTDAGAAVVPALLALMAWGDRWATPPGGPPVELVHHDCGARFTPTVSCSGCGAPVTAETVAVLPGPGAADGPGTRLLHHRARAAVRSELSDAAGPGRGER